MIIVNAYLDKMDFIPLAYFQTDIFQSIGNFGSNDVSAVFYGTDQMIQKQGLIMFFMDVLAIHTFSLPYLPTPQQSCGEFFD